MTMTALFLLACSLGNNSIYIGTQPPSLPPETPTATATATPTPTPLPPTPTVLAIEDLINDIAFIDEFGRDFAEKRIIDVYKKVSPSVVNVNTQILRRSFFFEAIPEEGAGSGFVLDAEGHILTNFHVIDQAQSIEITFVDETTLPAELVGADPRNDIALLRVDAPQGLLVPVKLGESAGLQVGQRAVVIGNPFGQFGSTLTTGVISALNRSLRGQDGREITGIIQTDAAINQGNSGGPLLDSAGQVIGINTAIFSPSGTNAGVGFAVPVDTIRRVLPDLLELGRYRHPWLGIRYAYRITPGLSSLLELPIDEGLLLVELYSDGPLARQHVQGAQEEVIVGNQRVFIDGDIIKAIDGQPVTSLEQLDVVLTAYQVGDSVEVTYLRRSEEATVVVVLEEEAIR
ncbi:MAG: trypsin-like peptidase domain-containing protein [Anaerolineae bacterium]|nr:trypsin-like peptidase domain-containing protein [Anaerolineae bacterium]